MSGSPTERPAREFPRIGRDLAYGWRSLRRQAPPSIPLEERSALRRRLAELYYSDLSRRARANLLDLEDRVRGRDDPRIPPRRMQFVGQGDFRAAGTEFRRHFVELGGLQPHHDVLDVGSGIGRMAFGLADWLTGRYEGFDVVPDAVDWCQRRITPRHPNFRFQLADIRNSEYNPRGRVEADEYRFPYEDGSFDFAFLTSVFTHMLPPAVDNYLAELGRVVRGGGRLFATYYLVDDHSRARLDESYPNLRFDHGDYVTSEPGRPEAAVGLLENWVRRAHERHGLPIEGIFGGRWCGRERATSYQDIVISVARHLAA